MTLNEYWDKVKHLSQYEKSTYPIKGLAIEVAECLEIFVKNERKPKTPEDTESMLVDELGDVLWFLCEIHKNDITDFGQSTTSEQGVVSDIENQLWVSLSDLLFVIKNNRYWSYPMYFLMDVIHQVGFERIALANINKLLKRAENNQICDHE